MVIERIASLDGVIEIGARARGSTAVCPGCGERSRRVNSRYERCLADAAVGGQPVRIRLRVRRFTCTRVSCAHKTFVEQVEDLTMRYGRHSQLLRTMLQTIGLMLAGRAGSRLTRPSPPTTPTYGPSRQGATTSRRTTSGWRSGQRRRPMRRRSTGGW